MAPVGLFGVTKTTARTPSISVAARAGSGRKPSLASQGSTRQGMPSASSVMRWLKYQGAGSITASPAPASVIIASVKAKLPPAVMAISAAPTRPA